MTSYIKKPNEEFRNSIVETLRHEKIDLMILIRHSQNSFQKFVSASDMQIIFQFGIPVLILQSKTYN